MKKIFIIIAIVLFISCNKGNKEEKSINIQNTNEQNVSNNISVKNDQVNVERVKMTFDTVPSGALCIVGDLLLDSTPITLNLEKKEQTIRFERLRYYPEEINISVDQMEENASKKINLRENKAFTEDFYLSYSSRRQADGIGKEFCIYVYDENAKLIRIDSYVRVEKVGYYAITTNDKGQILTKQYHSTDGDKGGVEHFEYNTDGLLVKRYYDSDKVKLNYEYYYRDGILDKMVSKSEKGTSIFDYIVEIKYGSKDSEYTKEVTEKYFYPDSTDEERKKALADDFLPRTIYTYQ